MTNFDMVSVGERIRQLRCESDLKQEELAEKVGVDRTTISLYESGKSQMSLGVLVSLAKFFQVSTDYILCMTDY